MAASSASTEDQAPAWVNALWIGLPFNCQTAIDWNQRKKMIILTAFDMSLAQKLFLFEVSDVYQIFNEAYGIFWCDIHYWHVTGTSMLLNKFPILLLCNKELFPPASAKGQPTFVILLRAPGVRKAWQITDFCPTWSCCQHTSAGGRWRSYGGRREDTVFYVIPYYSCFWYLHSNTGQLKRWTGDQSLDGTWTACHNLYMGD